MLLDRLNYFAPLETQTLRERLLSCNLSTKVGSAPSTPTHKSRSPVHSRLSVNSVEENEMPTGPASTELFIGGLLLRHILQLVCNANAITELQTISQPGGGGSVLNQRQVKVATGIFPTASLMNHSCNPTVISRYFSLLFFYGIPIDICIYLDEEIFLLPVCAITLSLCDYGYKN